MFKQIFFILLILCNVFSATHIVTPSSISLQDTITSAASGDVIELRNGPHCYILPKLETKMRDDINFISYSNDTVEKVITYYNGITLSNYDTILGINFRWRDTISSVGGNIGFLGGSNIGGLLIYGNKFTRPSSVSYSGGRGLFITRSNSSVIVPPTVFRKNICDSVRIWFGTADTNMVNNVTADSNILINSRLNIGSKGKFKWNYCYQGGDFNFLGDSLLIEWNYGGSFFSGDPEYFGNDDNIKPTYGSIVQYNYLDSLAHNTIWDATIDFKFNNNTIPNSRCSYYNHNTGYVDSSKNVLIYENWMSGTSNAQYIGFFTTGTSSDIRMTRNTFYGQQWTPIQMNALILRDTIDSSAFRYTTDVTNFDVKIDNTVIDIKSYVLDTNKYQFLKQNVPSNPLRFSNGRRRTPKEYLTYLYGKDSSATTISFACSLSTAFRYGGRYFSMGRVNAWWYGDTAQIVVQHCTDTTGSISSTIVDSLIAGQNANITVSALNNNTKYFYRTITNGISSEATNLHDTTLWSSVSTLSNPPLEDSVVSSQSIDTLKLICKALNATGYQWYRNNSIMNGETDSVLTILADSLFYNSKYIIYCMVSNGITSLKSNEWIFNNGVNSKSGVFFRGIWRANRNKN